MSKLGGRPPLPGGRHRIAIVFLKEDREKLVAAANGNISEWIRKAAQRGLSRHLARVLLPRGQDTAKVYTSISGDQMSLIKKRCQELGIGRPATYLRYAALDLLNTTPARQADNYHELVDRFEKWLRSDAQYWLATGAPENRPVALDGAQQTDQDSTGEGDQ